MIALSKIKSNTVDGIAIELQTIWGLETGRAYDEAKKIERMKKVYNSVKAVIQKRKKKGIRKKYIIAWKKDIMKKWRSTPRLYYAIKDLKI